MRHCAGKRLPGDDWDQAAPTKPILTEPMPTKHLASQPGIVTENPSSARKA